MFLRAGNVYRSIYAHLEHQNRQPCDHVIPQGKSTRMHNAFGCPLIALCSFLYILTSQSKLLHTSLTMGKMFLLQEEKNADPQLKYPLHMSGRLGRWAALPTKRYTVREDRGVGRQWYDA